MIAQEDVVSDKKHMATSNVQEFLYVIRPTRLAMLVEGPTEREAWIISEHFEYLRSLTEKRVVILAGRTLNSDESDFGIVILRARDESTAKAIVEHDPAVRERIMQAELYPYRVALFGCIEEQTA
jgi:uncharacterized protein YciI